MIKTFYIAQNERGLLFRRQDFVRVLTPGTTTMLGRSSSVQTYNLNEPEAEIPNLEFLLSTHGDALREHLTVLRTGANEAALVRVGGLWIGVGRAQLRAFWKGFVEVEVHVFDLEGDPELPAEILRRLGEQNVPGLQQVQVAESQVGMLFVNGNFVRPLESGRYAFWQLGQKVQVLTLDRNRPAPDFPQEDALIEQHPDFVAQHAELVAPGPQEVALVRFRGRVIAALPPTSRKLFWKGVTVQLIDLTSESELPPALVAELVNGLPEVVQLVGKYLHVREVPDQHLGLLYQDGALFKQLGSGSHAFWVFGRTLRSEATDLRLRTLEVSGQDILSRDKVPLRLNLTAGVRVSDPVQARARLADVDAHLYKELQFALRTAVGTRTLDELLEDKGGIDAAISEQVSARLAGLGIEVLSVGVKDIILPGEIKAVLLKVVEAEKAAQANVIRRREETAATRSMLNTAKVMEENPVALRLKELEVLERVAEKVGHINVNGTLENVLTDIVRIRT